MLAFNAAGRSDIGSARKTNQDAYLIRPDLGIFAVADGMGGHERGQDASRAVVEHLGAIPPPGEARQLLRAVGDALTACHEHLGSITSGPRPPGSTVVALLLADRHFACIWAGDSRLYRHRRGRFEQLTRDHSARQDLIDQGVNEPSIDVAGRITRAIGAGLELELDVIQDAVEPGDLFLLCTDGLTSVLDLADIERLIREGDPEGSALGLIQAALERAAADNVTVVLVEAEPFDPDATIPDPTRGGG